MWTIFYEHGFESKKNIRKVVLFSINILAQIILILLYNTIIYICIFFTYIFLYIYTYNVRIYFYLIWLYSFICLQHHPFPISSFFCNRPGLCKILLIFFQQDFIFLFFSSIYRFYCLYTKKNIFKRCACLRYFFFFSFNSGFF